MQLNSTKYKLRLLWEEAQANEYNLSFELLKRERILKHPSINTTLLVVHKKLSFLDTDWEYVSDVFTQNSGTENYQYKVWEFEFDRLPKKFIPYINWTIVYDYSDSNNLDIRQNKNIQVFNYDSTLDRYEKVKLSLGTIIMAKDESYRDSIYSVRAKALLTIINPEVYV